MKTNNMNNQTNNQEEVTEVYEKPAIEVIEMEMESSFLAGSGEDFKDGGGYDGW